MGNDAAADAPDIVETTGDVTHRGVIVEHVPGDHVTVLLPSGQLVVVPWAEVRRAERDASAPILPSPETAEALPPPPPRPPPTQDLDYDTTGIGPRGEPLRVGIARRTIAVRATNPSLQLQILTGFDSASIAMPNGHGGLSSVAVPIPIFEPLCTGSCSLVLGVGVTYSLRVDRGRARRVTITERTVGLSVDFEDRHVQRRRRWIGITATAIFGGALMGLAYALGDDDCGPYGCDYGGRRQGMFWSGVVLVTTPVLSFMIPLFTLDRSVVETIETR